MKRTLLLTVALLMATPCHSAEITIYRGEIIVTGRIEQDDYEKFLGTAAGMVDGKKQTVRISSPGGHMNPAIRIGKFIREQGWKTLVPEFGHCASAWLEAEAAEHQRDELPRREATDQIAGSRAVASGIVEAIGGVDVDAAAAERADDGVAPRAVGLLARAGDSLCRLLGAEQRVELARAAIERD